MILKRAAGDPAALSSLTPGKEILMIIDYNNKNIPPNYLHVLSTIKEKEKNLLWQITQHVQETSDSSAAISALKQYLIDTNTKFEGWTEDEVAKNLYNDIFEHSVITGPLNDVWVQRIMITSWNSIAVQFINGETITIGGFPSPQIAQDIIHGLLQESHTEIDKGRVTGKLKTGIRITAFFPPVVSDRVGVYCSITKLSHRQFTRQDYSSNDFAANGELDFLLTALQHGVSLLLVGGSGSGKTSFMEFLLNELPPSKRILVIEQSEREVLTGTNLWAKDLSEIDKITENALFLNPDVIGYNTDQCFAQSASVRGCPVIGLSVASDPMQGLHQAALQWWQCHPEIDYSTAVKLSGEAFPIIVTLHQYPDCKRRVANISQCNYDGHIQLHTLWEFEVREIIENSNRYVIHGSHKQQMEISKSLQNKMKIYGYSQTSLEKN